MKSYTDIEQSKTLSGILSLESADMLYWAGEYITHPYMEGQHKDEQIPIWSLAALLGVLPKEIKDEDYENEITPLLYPMQGKWYMVYNEIDTDGYCPYLEKTGSTPIDACYEMILKLHELNLL